MSAPLRSIYKRLFRWRKAITIVIGLAVITLLCFVWQDVLTSNPSVSLVVVPIVTGIIVVLIDDFFSFRKHYLALQTEINGNYRRVQDDEISNQFNIMSSKLERNLLDPARGEWVGFEKVIAVWILVHQNDTETDFYRYLPSNDFKNFIQHGYYQAIKDFQEPLTLFYLGCERLSIWTQDEEKKLQYRLEYGSSFHNILPTDDGKRTILKQYSEYMGPEIKKFRPSIDREYENLKPLLDTSLLSSLKQYLY